MKYIIFLLSLTIIFAQGDLKISESNNQLTFKYSNSDTNFKDRYLIAYFFTSFSPEAKIISQKLNNNSSDIAIPENAVYGLFKIRNDRIEDNNKGNFWDWTSSKSIKNKNLRIAKSYLGNNPQNYNRNADFDKARDHLEKELKEFPNNIVAKIALLTLQLDLRKMDYDTYGKQLYKELNDWDQNQSEEEVGAVTRALKSLNKEEKANKLEFDFATNNPKSALAEEVFISKMSSVDNPNDFNIMCEKYFEFFPDSDDNSLIFNAFLISLFATKNYNEIENVVNKISNPKANYYSIFAGNIRENKKILSQIADKSDSIIRNYYQKSIDLYSQSPNDNYEGKIENNLSKAITHAQFGDYLLAMEDSSKAFDQFRSSIELSASNPSQKLISKTDSIAKNLGKTFNKNKYISDKDLKYDEIEIEKLSGIYKYTNGDFYDIETDINKNLVIVFYSTWCGPCQEMLPALEQLQEDFKEEKQTKLIVIDTWEDPANRWNNLNAFIEDINPQFNMLVDETDFMPQKYGVTGLPWILITDKELNIKFSEQGFEDQESFINSVKTKLKYLQNGNN